MSEQDKREHEAAQDGATEMEGEKHQEPSSGNMVISPPPAAFETK